MDVMWLYGGSDIAWIPELGHKRQARGLLVGLHTHSHGHNSQVYSLTVLRLLCWEEVQTNRCRKTTWWGSESPWNEVPGQPPVTSTSFSLLFQLQLPSACSTEPQPANWRFPQISDPENVRDHNIYYILVLSSKNLEWFIMHQEIIRVPTDLFI
jgi:hypothetical protein